MISNLSHLTHHQERHHQQTLICQIEIKCFRGKYCCMLKVQEVGLLWRSATKVGSLVILAHHCDVTNTHVNRQIPSHVGLGSRCSSTKGPSWVSSPRRDGFTWPPYNQYGIALHQAVVYTVKEALTWRHFPTNSIPMWPWLVTCKASMFVFPTFPPIFRGLSFSRIESRQITKICRGGDETWGFHKMKPLAKGLGVVPSAKVAAVKLLEKVKVWRCAMKIHLPPSVSSDVHLSIAVGGLPPPLPHRHSSCFVHPLQRLPPTCRISVRPPTHPGWG